MSLSKPKRMMYNLLGMYLNGLYSSPVKTKALTSCSMAVLGNYLSQRLSGAKRVDQDALVAFALFGLLFGGTVPHFFYKWVPRMTGNSFATFLVERIIYAPCYQAFALYTLARFEGKSHVESMKNLRELYRPVLGANLRYLTILQFVNIRYVPPMLRVLVVNAIGLVWSIYLAQKREKVAAEKRMRP